MVIASSILIQLLLLLEMQIKYKYRVVFCVLLPVIWLWRSVNAVQDLFECRVPST